MSRLHLTKTSLSNGLHASLGALGVLLPAAKGWSHPQFYGSAAVIVYAAVKEFWWDLRYEDEETSGGWWGGVQDFAGYLAGLWVANMILFL
jgi:hypothetical protein